MPRFKTIDNVRVQCTAEEEAVADADAARMPMHKWTEDIGKTDGKMPRYLEDLITNNSSLVITTEMKTRYNEKIALRATKP